MPDPTTMKDHIQELQQDLEEAHLKIKFQEEQLAEYALLQSTDRATFQNKVHELKETIRRLECTQDQS